MLHFSTSSVLEGTESFLALSVAWLAESSSVLNRGVK
jgi:hypothetical protein